MTKVEIAIGILCIPLILVLMIAVLIIAAPDIYWSWRTSK